MTEAQAKTKASGATPVPPVVLVPGETASITAHEPVSSITPFDQQAHDLLLKSIDQVATDWVGELTHIRKNSEEVEKLVLKRASKVKSDITALYLLGSAAMAEARRGDEINTQLANELDRLAEGEA